MYFKINAKKLLCAEQELGVQGLGDYKSLILTETMMPHRITFSCARSLISNTEKTPIFSHRWSQNHMSNDLDLMICIRLVNSGLYKKSEKEIILRDL